MLKTLFAVSAIILITTLNYGQDIKKESETLKTKMEVFASRTGNITKFVDYKLPNISRTYGVRKQESEK